MFLTTPEILPPASETTRKPDYCLDQPVQENGGSPSLNLKIRCLEVVETFRINSFNSVDLKFIQQLAANTTIIALAKTLPYPATAVALAVLAAVCMAHDRFALRFARRLLGEDGLDDAASTFAKIAGKERK